MLPASAAVAAPAAPTGAAAGNQPAPAAQTNPIFGLLRMLAVWWLFRSFFSGGGGGGAKQSTSQLARSDYFLPLMQRATPIDVAMVLSEEKVLAPGWLAFGGGGGPESRTRAGDAARVVWTQSNVPLATAAESKVTVSYTPSESVKNNGTLFLHVIVGLSGQPLDASLEGYEASKVFNRTFSAVAFYPRPKKKGGVNLLGGSTTGEELEEEVLFKKEKSDTATDFKAKKEKEEEEEEEKGEEAPPVGGGSGGSSSSSKGSKGSSGGSNKKKNEASKPPREIVSFLKPNLTVAMIDDFQAYARGKIPEQLTNILDLNEEAHTYNPTLWLNDFWLMRSHLLQMNSTVTGPVYLHLSLYFLPSWKLLLFTSMEQSFQMQQSWGAMNDGEPDQLKRVLTEGNPYFLALTMVVSMLHSVFDALAFKNDIGFWKGKQDVAGLSVRTIGFNAVCQAIIFLYLLDNDTSFVVLASTAVGVAIEFWKLTQAMHVSLERRPPGSSSVLPFRLKFKDKASYTDSKTDEHDATAMKYMSLALLPCVGGYSLYTLKYQTHRSWYSWVLSSLVGAVYTFGFVLMCPQLYLNYKLKSVAHLPWRQMTYKFLNTIIDDLFAFVIKMPTLHRLAVFRDDVVFAIYLYQRWIYRVDATRANEFGFVAAEAAEGEEGGAASADVAAAPAALPAGTSAAAAEATTAATAAAAAPSAAGVRKRRGEKDDDIAEDEEEAEAEGAGTATGGSKKDE